MDRYFVTENGVEREVTVEQFCYAEMRAGFHGPGHYEKPMRPATGGFGSTKYSNTKHEETISGRVRYDFTANRDPANLFEGGGMKTVTVYKINDRTFIDVVDFIRAISDAPNAISKQSLIDKLWELDEQGQKLKVWNES